MTVFVRIHFGAYFDQVHVHETIYEIVYETFEVELSMLLDEQIDIMQVRRRL